MAGFRRILRAPAGRITNQTLLVALVLVFGNGQPSPMASPGWRSCCSSRGRAGWSAAVCAAAVPAGGCRCCWLRWSSSRSGPGLAMPPVWCTRSPADRGCGCISPSRSSWCPWSCGISSPGGSGRGGRICHDEPSCGPGCWGRGRPGFTSRRPGRSGWAGSPVLTGASPGPTRPGRSIRTPCPPRAGSWTRSRPSIRIGGG